MSEPTETMHKTPEAAARLGMSIRTVKTLIASGELPSVKIRGARRIEESAIVAFLAERREGGGDA